MGRLPRTLRARLVLAAGGAIVAAIALFAVATVVLVGRQLNSTLDSSLRQRAQSVAELAVSDPAVLDAPGALESPVSGREISVEVIDAHGRLLARSLNLGAALIPPGRAAGAALRRGRAGFADVSIAGRAFRMFAAPVPDAGGPAAGGAVLVASATGDIATTQRRLGTAVAITGAVVALLAVLVAAALSRRGLRPLRELAVAAQEIERTADPAQRLPAAGATDEIGQLTGVLNRMLSALDRARNAERRFLADASHELRTPVTALSGNIEYAARHGADAEVLADLQRDAARLTRLVDDLLVLERAAERAVAADRVDLARLAARVASEMGDERIVFSGGPGVVIGEEEALGRALRNLIENGLSHGAGRVTVTVRGDRSRVRVSVTDEGPGPDPASRERIFERFWRGPQTGERTGSGLGLSIVAAIAERHGGSTSVDESTFTIELPAAGDPAG
ncbi:MAG TPA: HAMP domain-containing sensor histidine kinase [Solirubrobacteraceae bacterium]|nr:HAMP domain-containing sensor histidine kinase [Solirubrobacteraceae bacterium]